MSSFRPSWQRLLLNRIVGKLSADYKDRIVFQTPESPAHAVHIMQMGHVLLDPFPVTGERFYELFVHGTCFGKYFLTTIRARKALMPLCFVVTPKVCSCADKSFCVFFKFMYLLGDYQPSLEALSIALPVVTMPSATHIGGRY